MKMAVVLVDYCVVLLWCLLSLLLFYGGDAFVIVSHQEILNPVKSAQQQPSFFSKSLSLSLLRRKFPATIVFQTEEFGPTPSSGDNKPKLFQLEKPLGIILEEIEEGKPLGVTIKEKTDQGSASQIKEIVPGMKLSSVNGKECCYLTFDEVMDIIVKAEGRVELSVEEVVPVPTVKWSAPEVESPILKFCSFSNCQDNGAAYTVRMAQLFCPKSVKLGSTGCLGACQFGPNLSAKSESGQATFKRVKSKEDIHQILMSEFGMRPQVEL